MATDLSTANVVDTKSGTGWTIDVTNCNLLSDLSIKDFAMLIDSVVESNTNITKTSQTVLTYNGASIPSSTIEVRRVTPQNRFQEINFAEKLSSTVFNEEIDRIIRKAYEYTLNGIGPGSVATVQTPLDDVYPTGWDGDVVRPATRNALFDKFELQGDLAANEAITGDWTATTQTDLDNSTKLATTAYADTRVANALSSSPTLGGNPTSVTPSATDSDTSIATTAFVNNRAREDACLAIRDNTPTVTSGATTDVTGYNDEKLDVGSNFNATTGVYTVPSNGFYRISYNIEINAGATTFDRKIFLISTTPQGYRVFDEGHSTSTGDGRGGSAGSILTELSTNDEVKLQISCTTDSGAVYTLELAVFSVERVFT